MLAAALCRQRRRSQPTRRPSARPLCRARRRRVRPKPPAPPPAPSGSPGSRLADAARDVRASQLDDLLTIVVAEQASAVTSGTTKTQRTSSAKNSRHRARRASPKRSARWPTSPDCRGDTQLAGQGTTSRRHHLEHHADRARLHVLPNGALLVEATKDVQINSERQTITVRGIVRPADIDADNSVRSNRLGQLEVRVNGKGVVGDAIKRPFFLYRLLLGLLPF